MTSALGKLYHLDFQDLMSKHKVYAISILKIVNKLNSFINKVKSPFSQFLAHSPILLPLTSIAITCSIAINYNKKKIVPFYNELMT